MLESILADILNRYLKPYVKKLDTSQLRLGIWKGDVCLENLELKEDIFTDFGVPVIIKSSHIGKIILKIPWKNLTKESIIVTIEDIYVIAGPVADTVYDEKKAKERKWEKKQAKLKDIEEARKKQESQKEEKDTFVEKLITHIVKNLLVKVNSIHIRYEDTITNPGHPMAVGITLDSIEMQTTDASYKPCVIKETTTMIYKLIQMDCLAFYWMVNAQPLANLEADVMKNKMKALIARKGQRSPRVNYVLQPLTAAARMKLITKPNYHNNESKVVVDVTNNVMEVVFSRTQYCSLLDTMESVDRAFVQHRYHKYRDKLNSNEISRARAWWQYAITCVLEEQVRRKWRMWSWSHMKTSREKCRVYTEKYLDKITSFTTSSSLVKELEAMEQEMDLFSILLCRQQAVNQKRHKTIRKMARKAIKEEAKVEKLQQKQIQQQQKQLEKQQQQQLKQQQKQQQLPTPAPSAEGEKRSTGFFSRLKNRLKHGDQPSGEEAKRQATVVAVPTKGSEISVTGQQAQPGREVMKQQAQPTTTPAPSKEAKKTAKELEQENITAEQLAIERQKLFEAIGYSEGGPKEEYPHEYVAEHVNLTLNLLTLTLVDERKNKKIGYIETTSIGASVRHRPADNGVTVHGSVGRITMLGVAQESHDTTIITTPETKEETGEPSPLIAVQFDMNPLGMTADFMLFASLNPLEIIYDSETIDSVINMFLIQKVIHFQELMAATVATVDQLQTQTRARLQYVLKKRKLMDIKLSLQSPYIVLPTAGIYNNSASVIVVDLGGLDITSSSKEFVGTGKDREAEDYYDTFNINLSTVQVLVAKPGEDWRHARVETDVTTSRLHILKPAGMKLVIQRSILQQDAFLPSLKVEGAFSSFEVFISDARLKELMKVLLSIQLPPPSLKNATKFIETDRDVLSIMVSEKLVNLDQVIKEDSDTILSGDDQSQPQSPTEVESKSHPSAIERSQSSTTVFTQLSLNMSVKEVSLELDHEEEGDSEKSVVKPLLHLKISGIMADVKNRSWDTSAAISVTDIVIFDHITLDSSNAPVKLLEADTLSTGKLLSLDAVLLNNTRKELAAKLSSGESSINCSMALLQLNVHENTIVELSRVAFLLAPLLLEIPKRGTDIRPVRHTAAGLHAKLASTPAITNLKMNVQACFKGLNIAVSDAKGPFISTKILALQVAGLLSSDKKEVTASMDGLVVTDLCGISSCAKVISVSGDDKMLEFKATLTSLPPSGDNDSSESELELNLKVQQLKIYLIMQLFSRFLTMISHLHFDPTLVNAVNAELHSAKAKKDTKITTSVPVRSRAARIHSKLNLQFHAPIVTLPIIGSSSALKFDLGNFKLITTESRVITLPNGFKYVQETIRITSDGIRADRVSSDDSSSCNMVPEMKFDVNVVRSLLENPVGIPLFDILLKLEHVKVHLGSEEIVAFLLLMSSFDELTQIGKEISHSATGSDRTKPTNVEVLPVAAVDNTSSNNIVPTDNALMAKIQADLETLQLDVAPLCRAEIKSISTIANVDSAKTTVTTRIKMMTMFDLAKEDEKITSYLEKSKSFAELNVIVYQKAHELKYSEDIPLPIKMDVDVKVSSFHLILNTNFINRSMEFGQTVMVDKNVLGKLARVAQDMVKALPDQLGKYNIFVSAPVIYLSLPKATHGQALVLNCGQLKVNNEYMKREGETRTSTKKEPAYINGYSFSLTQLTISRSIVSFFEESIKIKAQRTLLQPIQFSVTLSNSLSPHIITVPYTYIEATLGNVEITYGDEDIKSVVNLVATIIGNFKSKTDSELADEQSLSVQTSISDQQKSTATTTTTTTAVAPDATAAPAPVTLAFSAVLQSFCVNSYTDEPLLSPKLRDAAIPSSNALMTVNVTNLSVRGNVESNGHKVVSAELGDVEIIDTREKSSDKLTRKLLQSFKADPTKQSSIETSGALVKVTLNSSTESSEDYVNVEGRQILVLLDVEFILCVQGYANSIYEKIINPEKNELVHNAMQSLKSIGQQPKKVKYELAKTAEAVENERGFKLQGVVEKFAVALLDPEQSIEQVVILQTSVFSNLSKDSSKGQTKLSLRLDDLSMTSSHLLKLDSPTSYFLLPALVNVTFDMSTKGVTKLDLWVDVDCITLNISPAIVSLLVDVVSAIMPKKKEAVKEDEQLPAEIWNKHELSTGVWYLIPVMLKRANNSNESSVDIPERNETVVVEVKRFEVNVSRGLGPVSAELALNGNVYVEVKDIMGPLQAHGTLQMEASYYNDHHLLWEPMIEPLEDVNGKHTLWTATVKVQRNLSNDDVDSMRASVASLSSLSSLADSSARYKATLSANKPLQVTLSKKSLSLIKDTVEVFTANISRDAVTHKKPTYEFSSSSSAFTIKNKLGPGIVVCIQPGETLKCLQNQKFVKFGYGEMVDLAYAYGQDKFNRESKSVLLRQPKKKETKHCIDIRIAAFDPLKEISLSTPGLFYYTISRRNPKTNAIDKASIVVEIIFSDTKKNIFIRSPLQIHNHTDLSIDLVMQSVQAPQVILANSYYPIPLDKLNEPISLKPTGKNLETDMMLHWLSQEPLSVVKCTNKNDSTKRPYYLKVVKEIEDYANSDVNIDKDSPHHIFHIYPPAVLYNLLPVSVTVMDEVVGEGKDLTLLQLNPRELETLKITMNHGQQNNHGLFPVFDDMDEFTHFNVGEGKQATELSVRREDLGYHKLSLYSSYWMVNKTNLTLEYQDFESKKRTIHDEDQEIMCYSCDQCNQKRKIQFSAKLKDNRHTDWSAVISLNAAGTRGYARLKCGNVIHDLGIKIQLSRFTLTKVVTVSPYYLVINDTQHYIKCVMGDNSAVEVSSNNVKALWPKTADPYMHIIVQGYTSKNFQYRASSNNKDEIVENVLLKMGQDVVAIMVEFNITQNSHVITFCPYYVGAMPAKIVNACDSFSIRIRQNTASAKEQVILGPYETIMYTWDDPAGTRSLWWSVVGNMEKCNKPISLSKNSNGSFKLPSGFKATTNISQIQDMSWTIAKEETDDGFTKILPESSLTASSTTSLTVSTTASSSNSGYWISFLDHLQRVVMFTQDRDMVECAKAGEETGLPIMDFALSLKSIGLSLVNNMKKKEIAYIGITQSSVIWEVKKKKNKWITLNNEMISILEEEYGKNPKASNIDKGKLQADLSIMQIQSPYKGELRRTYYDGLSVHFKLNEKQIELSAKLGHMQVDNQLPFSVYPQVLYPLPPPPTVASTCEPKPFIEASVIVRRSDKVSMVHIQYAGLLIQEIAVNIDLGFLLSVISFFTLSNNQSHLGGYVVPQKKEALLPLKDFSSPSGKDIAVSRYFFTLIHFSPIKIRLSFNIRSYGKNLDPEEDTVAKQALNLLLHSLGVVLTSVQETEMKYAYLHLEYRQVTMNKLKDMVVKHYTNQTLYQIYSLIFGLDMLGNPVSLVKGVAGGAIDLFYEPYKGVVLGGDEFLQGLGIGLKSFLGGTVGGIAGAGAKVTGAVGDVFAKFTFDEEYIDRRQQQKVAPPKLGSKLGGFAKNVFQGVTGVVTQPVKGAKQEGVFGLAKGMGKGVVGLVMRPTGGLIDLASGSLDTVRRSTALNNVEVFEMRAPRFIDREGILTPYSAKSAQGNALLIALENGEYAATDSYVAHIDITTSPLCVLLITDMRILVVQKSKILEVFGWSINWEILHSKVRGIQLNGIALEAIYKSKRSGFDKLQSKYSPSYRLPNDKVAREAIDLINTTIEYN